jgi:hypothetical protein
MAACDSAATASPRFREPDPRWLRFPGCPAREVQVAGLWRSW